MALSQEHRLTGAWEVACLVKCLLGNQEDWDLDPQHPDKPGTIADVYNPNPGGMRRREMHPETSLDGQVMSSTEALLCVLRLGCGSSQGSSHYSPLFGLVWAAFTSAGGKAFTSWELGQVDVAASGCGHTLADCNPSGSFH